MKRLQTVLTLSFAAWTGLAAAQGGSGQPGGGDLVLLPAPADAWRTLVGHWERRVELAGSTVGHWETRSELAGSSAVVPLPGGGTGPRPYVAGSAAGPAGARHAVSLEWKDTWFSTLRLESRSPLDLRPFAGGMLEMDLHVDDLAQGGLRVKVACGEGCERSVSLLEPARGFAGRGWQHVSLAMSCFLREGGDFSRVTLPFALEGGGSGRVSVANVRLTRIGGPGLACPDHRTESVTPAMLAESWSLDWWLPRHEQKRQEARDLLAAGKAPRLVFIGDSITQGWEKEGREVWAAHFARYDALNLGFGGDRTENVLWRLQHGALDGLSPRAVVLMIGTNNTGHRAENPETTAAGIRRLVDEIRQRLPQAQVLLLGVFPREERPDGHLRRINERVNQLIRGFADGRHVHFANLDTAFTQPDGSLSREVMPDLLHLSPQGYALWQRAMDPVLTPLLNRP